MIGNLAAHLLGAPVLTEDADVACRRGAENRVRLMAALEELDAQTRLGGGAVGHLPKHNPQLLGATEIWNLTTVHGDLDLLYNPAGGGYGHLIRGAVWIDINGSAVLVASMDDIIASKELADREKDHKYLDALRQFQSEQSSNTP